VGINPAIRGRRIALDTVGFIYFIEEHPDYIRLVDPLFEAARKREREIVTSALTLLEVLVVPYRAGDRVLGERYEALLTRSRGVRLIDIDRSQLHAAALLRAQHRVKTPDAIQLAAAILHRCTSFVTNDRKLPSIPGLDIVQLRDLTPL
jgi:predicted nucleic acid-binding protein